MTSTTMRLALSFRSLESLNVQRFLRRKYVERGVKYSKVGLVVLTVLCLVLIGAQFLRTSSATSSELTAFDAKLQESLAIAREAPTPTDTKRDFSAIYQRAVFGPVGAVATVKPTVAPKAAAVTPLTLIGTFVSDGQAPYAIIEEQKKKNQDIFKLHDTVFGEAKLTAILPDRVEISRNGQTETLLLDTADSAGGGSEKSGGDSDEIVVDEAELDKNLENLPLLLTQARAVPFFKEGRAVGLRLFAIKAGSLFEKIGLQNGDVLKTVNGNSLADLSQAMQLFQKLKEERSINLVIERSSTERQIHYQIR